MSSAHGRARLMVSRPKPEARLKLSAGDAAAVAGCGRRMMPAPRPTPKVQARGPVRTGGVVSGRWSNRASGWCRRAGSMWPLDPVSCRATSLPRARGGGGARTTGSSCRCRCGRDVCPTSGCGGSRRPRTAPCSRGGRRCGASLAALGAGPGWPCVVTARPRAPHRRRSARRAGSRRRSTSSERSRPVVVCRLRFRRCCGRASPTARFGGRRAR